MLIQKFHPGMRLGQQPAIAASGNPLFIRQGHWDGGSTLHCVAMALALLGKLADPVYLPYHPFGPEQIVWDDAWPHYLTGLTLGELAEFVANLNLDVRSATSTASGMDLLRFVERELHAGWPVIVGWQQRQTVRRRSALVVGIEGRQSAQAFEPRALLLLDPSGDAPGLAGFNARIDVHGGELIHYWSTSAARTVSLVGVLSIRTIDPPASRAVD
ncbi:hypothetical protein [Burkholderia vietnamiensis]|uniref:hypothetical protein n=1 Tax=Burkholderia vietnamiensis TaxID=60552 RepID=UPI001CF21038|nr:hypothetical protein [Burkholderia vietnamiensis]MCA7988691.1 hypothetical protein [Burkholderia vietnamiensis]HDR8934489.1 hypothetical protein [Burkholderia vietnamiensis]